MGIRFTCPNGHKLNVKDHLAGKRAVCPNCGAKVTIPSAEFSDKAAELPSVPPSAMVVDAPSVVIPVIDAPEIPQIATASLPANAGLPRSADVTSAAVVPSVSVLIAQRRKRSRMQVKIAAVLMAIVVVLLFILVWVLMKNATPEVTTESVEKVTSAQEGQGSAQSFTAIYAYDILTYGHI